MFIDTIEILDEQRRTTFTSSGSKDSKRVIFNRIGFNFSPFNT